MTKGSNKFCMASKILELKHMSKAGYLSAIYLKLSDLDNTKIIYFVSISIF